MADSKITALTALTSADPANDMIPIVDVSDTPPASGNTKRISINNILAASGTATLASATITGAATVGTTFGVTGVSTFAAGTALLPALTTTGDTNTGIYYPAADTFAVTTAGTERYRVDTSGNVGIGVTPSAWSTYKAIQVGQIGAFWANPSGTDVYLSANQYFGSGSDRYIANGLATIYKQNAGVHSWLNAPSGTAGNAITFTQAMTLDASGNLLLNATSFAVNNGKLRIQHTGLAGEWAIQTASNTTDGYAAVFYTTTGQAGFISVSGTSATFSTSSDYRLKEAVQPLVGGLARISALKPSIYKWKADGSNGEGFLAHELAEVVPLAVTGEKDAVNDDGSIKAQGVDLSKVVPILVAAIQELAAEVNALKNA